MEYPKTLAQLCLESQDPWGQANRTKFSEEGEEGLTYFEFRDHSVLGFDQNKKPFTLKLVYDMNAAGQPDLVYLG